MADYISREAAIEACCMNCQCIDQEDDKSACWCMDKDHFNQIPAADVRPVVRGTWLEPDDDYGYLVCSMCEERSPNDERWHFCPNCGADMRAASDRPYCGERAASDRPYGDGRE